MARRIYDGFMFFNELELLDIRLHELSKVVEQFILVESTKTHSNKDKPLYYADNKSSFKKFNDKIIHIVVEDMPKDPNSWSRENHQRNCIERGLKKAKTTENDYLIISDADEIPRATAVKEYFKGKRMREYPHTFLQDIHYYYLNCYNHSEWRGSVIVPCELAKSAYLQIFRDLKDEYDTIPNGGWHFGYLGGIDRVQQKLNAFAHTEFNTRAFNSKKYITARLEDGADFYDLENKLTFRNIDDSYPKYIKSNVSKFKSLIRN